MSRPHAWLELRVWALMAVPMGLLTGGVAGVMVNTIFTGVTAEWLLGVAVALATGAASLANLFSLFWSHWSRGRDRIGALQRLQGGLGMGLIACAAMPPGPSGLALLVATIVACQVLWCGIITIRGSVWRMNYTRAARTVFATRNQVLVSACSAGVGALAGFVIELDAGAFRALFATGAVFAFASMALQRRGRMRRARQLLAAEQLAIEDQRFDVTRFWAILRDDAPYRRYLICMMLYGSGNMMVTAVLILVLSQNLGIGGFTQVLLTASLPAVLTPLTTPYWGRLLTDRHIVDFRAINSRTFVAAMLAYLLGAALGALPLIWLGAVLQGGGVAGGSLGWALGHNDFAPDDRAADYLGLHITLTGLRGLIAPLLGVALHSALEHASPGAGIWALALPAALTTLGSIGFHRTRKRLE